MRTFVGTSGYSYKEWKGSFYPPDLPESAMLRYYGARFKTVEINNTFYRMPSSSMLGRWPEQVPADFTFVLKASQRITHVKRLKDATSEVAYFYGSASVLGEQLGPVLFQLPPYMRKDLSRLTDFLAVLGPGRRAAFEFRHVSWYEDEVYELLQAHGAALCIADTDEHRCPFVVTADWGYLRLRGTDYPGAELQAWADRVQAQGWSDAYVFFKHEEAGRGPQLAAEFIELLG